MPVAAAPQPAQSTGVLIGRSKQSLYPEDAPLISGLRLALEENAAKRTTKNNVSCLLSFGHWLFAKKRKPLARLDSETLLEDAHEFSGKPTRLLTALGHLRTWQSTGGVVPIAGRTELNPYPRDASLIKDYKDETATETGRMYATALRSFSDYLRANNKIGIATRLSGKALAQDVKSYRVDAAAGNATISSALAQLRKSRAGARAMERERHIPSVADTEEAAPVESRRVGEPAAQDLHEAGSLPDELHAQGDDQEQHNLHRLASEWQPSESANAGGSGGSMPAARAPAESTRSLIKRGKLPLYSQDAPLLAGLKEALIEADVAKGTARNNVSRLHSFGHWLFANNKDPIKDRLDNKSLTDDAREFSESPRRLLTAIGHLRTWLSTGGVAPIASRAQLNPYPQDAALIDDYRDEAATRNGTRNASALRSFSDHLRLSNKKGIAGRLFGDALHGDLKSYKQHAGSDARIGAALAHLRNSQAGAKAIESERRIPPVPDPEEASPTEPMRVGHAAAERRDQDLSSWLMDEPDPSSPVLQSAQLMGIVIGQSEQPLFSEDAELISGLERALIKGKRKEGYAKDYVRTVRSFGHWLYKNDKASIVARLDNKSLTDGGEVLEFVGKGDPKRLLKAIDRLRTWRSTGAVAPNIGRAELTQESMSVGDAAAQHSASPDARSWPNELPANAHDRDVRLGPTDEPGYWSSVESALRHHQTPDLVESAPQPSHERGLPGAKRQRTLDDPQGVASERQVSEIANSDVEVGAMPTGSAPQPGSIGGLKANSSRQPLFSQDAPLILGLKEVLLNGGAAERTAKDYVNTLLRFGRWLFENNKKPIGPRLHNESLTNDAREFMKTGKSKLLLTAIDHLRTSRSTGGVVPIPGRAEANPYPEDAALIKEYKNEAATRTASTYATSLSGFSDYLRQNNKQGIAGRLSGKALDRDVKSYREDADGCRKTGSALAHLRKSQAGARAMERERIRHIPEDAPPMEPKHVGDAAGENWASHDTGGWPKELRANAGDQDLRLGLTDEPGPSWSVESAPRQRPAPDPGASERQQSWHQGARPRSNLLPSQELLINDERDTAEVRPAKRQRTLDNPQDVAAGRQPSEIANSGDRRLTPAPTHQPGASPGEVQDMMQAGHRSTSPWSPQMPLNFDWSMWPTSEPAPSPGPSTSEEDTLTWLAKELERREMLAGTRPQSMMPSPGPSTSKEDTLTASPSSDARVGGLDRTASSRVAAGSVLGATEWLSDAHIQSDYDFLEQQLQGIDPALAARTRLVSPSVSHLLRHLGPQGAESTLLSIYHQSDAPADFLFLPVNNGTATRPGTHWSLLFVDGRNPQARVAYHYDSLQQAGYNDEPAQQLAEGLTATLAPARMPRQSNDHDCGVFVVDGTWALVQRLLNGERPDHEPLHLDNLVADRQALQNRLTRL
ncbi:Ulp1 family isopeptidase [Mesorhizobium sp. WSM4083]|uniref:Ulp1 family isopeptidase n=1 Tax=Mesorhizobium sp. WSM4083 TaxID=3446363 RepID=UPI003F4FA30F